MPAPLHQRVPLRECARCRKRFKPGDRTITVFIIQKVADNMDRGKQEGAWLSDDFEMAHVSCADPSLDGTVITA